MFESVQRLVPGLPCVLAPLKGNCVCQSLGRPGGLVSAILGGTWIDGVAPVNAGRPVRRS